MLSATLLVDQVHTDPDLETAQRVIDALLEYMTPAEARTFLLEAVEAYR